MLIRGMRKHHVDDNPKPKGMRPGNQGVEISKRTEQRIDIRIVGNVIAIVLHRRDEEGRQPDGVDAERGDVIEPRGYTGEITNPIAARVQKTARIDLVNHRTLPPGWCRLGDRLRHRMLLISGRVEPILSSSAEVRRGGDGASRPNRGCANF